MKLRWVGARLPSSTTNARSGWTSSTESWMKPWPLRTAGSGRCRTMRSAATVRAKPSANCWPSRRLKLAAAVVLFRGQVALVPADAQPKRVGESLRSRAAFVDRHTRALGGNLSPPATSDDQVVQRSGPARTAGLLVISPGTHPCRRRGAATLCWAPGCRPSPRALDARTLRRAARRGSAPFHPAAPVS